MNLRAPLLAFSLSCLFITQVQAQNVPSAEEIIKKNLETARKDNKNVFIMFHASWCGWCHKMDSSMNDASVKKYFTDNYVIDHLVVTESEKNRHLENPGAWNMLVKYHGKDSGIPFWLIFDKDGKLLADSKKRTPIQGPEAGENVGCPATDDEVNYFIEVLRKTSQLDDNALGKIKTVFSRNK